MNLFAPRSAIRGRLFALGSLTLLLVSTTVNAEQLSPEKQALLRKYEEIAKALHPQFGEVPLARANATLHLSSDYYFLPADEARRVLVDAWGNSPEAAADALGMVFPAGKSFVDDTWAAVVTYQPDGYVTDSDAKTTDYSKVLQNAWDNEDQLNDRRKTEHLIPIHLVGWAQPPSYDSEHHTLVWAREIHFGDQTDNTLNYDVRALGRRGVLSMNIVSEMSRITDVRNAAARLKNTGTFDFGSRYQDYKASTDKKAAYGVAGLVAAAVGVAAAQKLGLFALLLVFAKKLAVLVLAAFAAAVGWAARLFGKGKKGQAVSPELLPPPSQGAS